MKSYNPEVYLINFNVYLQLKLKSLKKKLKNKKKK